MARNEALVEAARWWDGPHYVVRTDGCEILFLPDAGQDLASLCNTDVEVRLGDGTRWSATVFTVTEVERLLARWTETGEAMSGGYFWCPDQLIVREPGVDHIVRVVLELLDCGDFHRVLQPLDHE